jgi:hypothetical protein
MRRVEIAIAGLVMLALGIGVAWYGAEASEWPRFVDKPPFEGAALIEISGVAIAVLGVGTLLYGLVLLRRQSLRA